MQANEYHIHELTRLVERSAFFLLMTLFKAFKEDFEELLKGNTLKTVIDEQIVFSDLNGSSEAVWSLLIASGYLKINEVQIKKDGLRRTLSHILSITNYETELMFGKMIHSWFKKAENNYPEFIRCMLTGNVKDMNNYMTRIARDTFSSFDTGTHPSEEAPERFLCRSLQKYDIIHAIQRLCPDNPVSSHARLALLAKIKEYGDL